jgi:hypothetical protein
MVWWCEKASGGFDMSTMDRFRRGIPFILHDPKSLVFNKQEGFMLKKIIYFFVVVVFFGMILVNPVCAAHVEPNKSQTGFEKGKDVPYSLEPILLLFLLDDVSGEENDFFVADYSMEDLPVSDKFSDRVDMGLLDNPDIHEASGIVTSRQDPDLLWTHNDSGDNSRIFLVRNDGTRQGTFLLKGAFNRDWEDIAAGPGPVEKVNYLFVGDIGDNRAVYTYKYIYRFPEPDVGTADASVNWVEVDNVEKITFVYPDGILMDAETLMVDPRTKDIYIVTKRERPVTVYRLPYPQSTTDIILAEKYGTLPFTYAVGGDVSADGKEILIKTYNEVYLWSRDQGESMRNAFMRPPFRCKYTPEPQGEAIAFALDGSGYYTLSEIFAGKLPRIYYYKRKK